MTFDEFERKWGEVRIGHGSYCPRSTATFFSAECNYGADILWRERMSDLKVCSELLPSEETLWERVKRLVPLILLGIPTSIFIQFYMTGWLVIKKKMNIRAAWREAADRETPL